MRDISTNKFSEVKKGYRLIKHKMIRVHNSWENITICVSTKWWLFTILY